MGRDGRVRRLAREESVSDRRCEPCARDDRERSKGVSASGRPAKPKLRRSVAARDRRRIVLQLDADRREQAICERSSRPDFLHARTVG